MRKLRFGEYEIHRIDRLNVGIFRVVPAGAKGKSGNIIRRTSDDGTALEHIGKYYGGYGAAARGLWDILLAERIEDPAVETVADAIEAAKADFAPLAEAADAIGRAGEAS